MEKDKKIEEKERFLKRLKRLKNQEIYFKHSTGVEFGSIIEVNQKKEFILIREKESKKTKKIGINSIDRGSLNELKIPM